MNIALWAAQGLLAFAFIMAGGMKLFAYDKYKKTTTRFPDDPGLPRGLVTFIGASEVAGAIGVVLPMAAGVLPQLTPLAAAGLALTMLLAIGHHLQHKDPAAKFVGAVVLLALSLFVAYGRGRGFFA